MSLYGNVKKVGSSSFQFDRIYTTRKAMDEAASTDGVYAGRYILVEYGQRYNNNSEERPEYIANKTIDLEAYGAVYDSTVWQKIYTNSGDKYIMVAELNATVPQIEFVQEDPITYIKVSGNDAQKGLIVGTIQDGHLIETAQLSNAKEQFNQPYFDTAIDTELSYTLHLPTMLNLKVDNDDIDFNENGFNPAYSFGEQEGVSAIAWIPEEIDNTKYNIVNNNGEVATDPETGNPIAELNNETNKVNVNTKMLFMSFPALGNVMNTLYDLLYGKPDTIDGEGSLRPYFQQFADKYQEITVPVVVNDTTVTIGGEVLEVTGAPGDTVKVPVSADMTGDIVPSGLQIKDGYLCDADNNQIQFTIPAANGLNDDLTWLNKVPGLADILANNTTGLASVLHSLFGYSDPLTGTTRYYLYTDWETKVDAKANNPAVINKPQVVGGYPITFTQTYETMDYFGDDPNINSITNYYIDANISDKLNASHYKIDYATWQIVSIAQDSIDFDSSQGNYDSTNSTVYVTTLSYEPGNDNTDGTIVTS